MDQAGVICKQEGVFRVNCMDCLDRTNVVQAAVARVVMEQQVRAYISQDVPFKLLLHVQLLTVFSVSLTFDNCHYKIY